MARLTWLEGGPAPFESGWSIFTKVLYWNVLAPAQLRRLIGVDEPQDGARPLHTLHSDWIDFPRFAGLLGVEEHRLRQGFLSQLGCPQPMRNRIRHAGVRHCVPCLTLGYHSVLFELALLGECPWHRQPLTPPCPHCLAYRGSGHRVGRPPCAHVETLVETALLRVAGPADDWLPRWDEYSEEWFHWWSRVLRAFSGGDDGLYELASMRPARRSQQTLAYWLKYAEALAGAPSPLVLALPDRPIDVLQWRPRTRERAPDTAPFDASYKSLRRYLRKHFGHGHQTCIRRLGGCRSAEHGYFRATLCPVAIVYDTWQRAYGSPCPIRSVQDECRGAGEHAVAGYPLRVLHALFVQALDALCRIDHKRGYVLSVPSGVAAWPFVSWRTTAAQETTTVFLPNQADLLQRLARLRCELPCDDGRRGQWIRCHWSRPLKTLLAVYAPDGVHQFDQVSL